MRDLNRGPMRNIGMVYEPIDPAILALVARYGHNPQALLPIFQELQSRYGGLTDKIVSDVARSLGIPPPRRRASPHSMRCSPRPRARRMPCASAIARPAGCGAAQVRAAAEQALGAAWVVERTSCLVSATALRRR